MTLHQTLLSAVPKSVQCNMEKRGNYRLNVPKFCAVNDYKFIQITHPKYIKFLSIDIDNNENITDFIDIYDICVDNSIPIPTIIVKTDKGWHVHWSLVNVMWKDNSKHMQFRKGVLSYLNNIFRGDPHFAGFIVRNPLHHEHKFIDIDYTFDDFKHIFDISKVIVNKTKNNSKNIKGIKHIDFRTIDVGQRNQVLYRYLTTYGFVNYKKISEKQFINEAKRVASLFKTPLASLEAKDVAQSVYRFIKNNYNEHYDKTYVIERNKKLAKEKEKRTLKKIFDGVKKLDYRLLLRSKYTFNKISKIVGVNNKTIKKHFNKIIEYIKSMLQTCKYTVEDIVKDVIKVPFNTSFTTSYTQATKYLAPI